MRQLRAGAGSGYSPGAEKGVTGNQDAAAELQAAYEVLGASRKQSGVSVYAFSSFDLVNSTSYKARAPSEWPDITKNFYYSVERTVERVQEDDDPLQPEVWKYIGDEVVMFTQVYDSDELYRALQMTADACTALQREFAGKDVTNPGSRRADRLGVKACCWVALVGGSVTADIRNIEVQTRAIPVRDFLGPDIDAGFRVGKSAMRGAVTVTATLAHLLVESDISRSRRMRLVGYQTLRGVWQGRPYPSIWYRRDWQDYEDEFDYDELQEIPRSRLATELDAGELKKVLEQTQNLATSRQVCAYFDQAERPPVRHSSPSSQVEVHVAAACFDRSTRRVLMRQRRHGKEVEKPHQWDFGCAVLSGQHSARETLVAEYRTKYKVELNPDISEVLSYYSFRRDGRVVSGFVLAAEVEAGPQEMLDYNQRRLEWFKVDEKPPSDAVADASRVFVGLGRLLDATSSE